MFMLAHVFPLEKTPVSMNIKLYWSFKSLKAFVYKSSGKASIQLFCISPTILNKSHFVLLMNLMTTSSKQKDDNERTWKS